MIVELVKMCLGCSIVDNIRGYETALENDYDSKTYGE